MQFDAPYLYCFDLHRGSGTDPLRKSRFNSFEQYIKLKWEYEDLI